MTDGAASSRSVAVVVPACDSEGSLDEVVERCAAVLAATGRPWEVVVVDDASCDGTWDLVRRAHEATPRVRGIRLARRVGQLPAFYFAAADAGASIVVSIDADLESYPEDIPALIEQIDRGHDVVSGARPRRAGRSPVRRLGSSGFAFLSRRLLRIPFGDPGCGLKAFDRDLVVAIAGRGPGAIHGLRPFGALADLATSPAEVPVRWRAPATASRHRWHRLAASVLDLGRQRGWLRRRHGAAALAVAVGGSAGARGRTARAAAVAVGVVGVLALAAEAVAARVAQGAPVEEPVVRDRAGRPGSTGPPDLVAVDEVDEATR